jgi:hypothetical protein
MSWKINGVAFVIEPSSFQWLDRSSHGEDGWGHPVYVAPREFELRWDYLSATGASQLQAFFNAIGSTGTAIVEIPKYANPEYIFYAYTGCVIHEPAWGAYFVQNQLDCKLLITNIRTT